MVQTNNFQHIYLLKSGFKTINSLTNSQRPTLTHKLSLLRIPFGGDLAKYVSKDTFLGYFLPLEKSSGSLGKGWVRSI